MTTVADPMFAPPRPGVWFLDLTHFTRPATRFQAELFPEQFVRGFGESLRRYGSLLDHLDNAFINGFWYFCPRPVGAPEEAHRTLDLLRTEGHRATEIGRIASGNGGVRFE